MAAEILLRRCKRITFARRQMPLTFDVCVAVHHFIATMEITNKMKQIFSFINLFNSALLVSGDKFAHPQEHFLTVYTGFGTMYRHCCRPVPRLRWNCSSISTVALYQKLHIQSKRAPENGRICRPKHVGLN
jgi:hypothetical protein